MNRKKRVRPGSPSRGEEMNRKKTFLPWAVLAVVLAGCSLGPKSMKADRPAYNVAIQQTESQQLLMNLVQRLGRLRNSPETTSTGVELKSGYDKFIRILALGFVRGKPLPGDIPEGA
jgi:hypothetical protein